MSTKQFVNQTLNIAELISHPNPIGFIRLVCNFFLEDDPFSEFGYELAKLELSSATSIMADIELEGDPNGAIQRTLTHLESAKGILNKYYSKKIDLECYMYYNIFGNQLRSLLEKGGIVQRELERIAFRQVVLHYMIQSDSKLLCKMLLEVPCFPDYRFYDYSGALAILLGTENWNDVMRMRKDQYIQQMSKLAESIKSIRGQIFNSPSQQILTEVYKMETITLFRSFLSDKLESDVIQELSAPKPNKLLLKLMSYFE